MLYTAAKFHPSTVRSCCEKFFKDCAIRTCGYHILFTIGGIRKKHHRHSSANGENVNKINLHGVETQGRPTLKTDSTVSK